MKTIEELYKEITNSEELKQELKTLTEEALSEFLKKHDCEATAKEFSDYARSLTEGELTDDDAQTAAGGYPLFPDW